MPDVKPYLDVRIGGIQRRVSDIGQLSTHSARLEFPADFPLAGLRRAQVDFELIASKLRDSPDDVRALLEAFVTGRNAEVQRLITELGLRESDFQIREGGIFWAVVIVGVLCCASEAY